MAYIKLLPLIFIVSCCYPKFTKHPTPNKIEIKKDSISKTGIANEFTVNTLQIVPQISIVFFSYNVNLFSGVKLSGN